NTKYAICAATRLARSAWPPGPRRSFASAAPASGVSFARSATAVWPPVTAGALVTHLPDAPAGHDDNGWFAEMPNPPLRGRPIRPRERLAFRPCGPRGRSDLIRVAPTATRTAPAARTAR